VKLDEWVAAACDQLGIEPGEVPTSLVLDLARDVAHHTLRPAAPVTAYLLGVAVGRGTDPREAASRLTALATSQPHPAENGNT